MERPEAKYFCNKCGYVGPNSQHENCSYFACTSLEYQYIEELERQLAERDVEIANIKEVEFPRRVEKVAEGWRGKCSRLEAHIALLREALESLAYHIDLDVTKNVLKRIASRALAATEMPDVVICDAEPVAWATMLGDFAHVHWGKDRPDFPIRYEFPLYARRKP